MAFEEITAEISRLLREMESRPGDRHELYLELRNKLNEIRAMEMPLPNDLVRLERELEAEFAGSRRSRSRRTSSRRRRRASRR